MTYVDMDFNIDIENIENSFDNIAKQLLSEYAIKINNHLEEITEIEFYFYKVGVHEDMYTHPHNRNSGQWRLHKQGIDITLDGSIKGQDGGILIRGLKEGNTYINGPIKSLTRILELFGPVSSTATMQLVKIKPNQKDIIKTFRHLPNKEQHSEFQYRKYRYLIDLDYIKIEQKEKDEIRKNPLII